MGIEGGHAIEDSLRLLRRFYDEGVRCRALSPVPRDMTDEMIVAMAKKGGVIQINFDCGYLNPEAAKAETARMKKARPIMEELLKKYGNDPDGMRKVFREARQRFPRTPVFTPR